VRRVAAERLMLLTVVALILVRPNVARVLSVLFLFYRFYWFLNLFCVFSGCICVYDCVCIELYVLLPLRRSETIIIVQGGPRK